MKTNKINTIIGEEFDSRLDLAVIQYLCEHVGIDRAKVITDEEIESINGNALMTAEFCRAMVRCCRRIARECNFISDIVPYIVNNFGHLSGHITQKRTEEILVNYISNDLINAGSGYVKEVLRDVCGCTYEELEDFGIAEWFEYDDFDEEEL